MVDLTQVQSPSGAKFTVAKNAADAFTGFLADLEGTGYKIDPGQSGGYSARNIAGTNTPSQHSYGLAIDVNSARNQQGAKTASDLPPNIADIAAAHGLTWGGGWSGNTRDPMHFQFAGGGGKVAQNAVDPDVAAGEALIRSMAPGGKPAAPAPADPDVAAGMALVRAISSPQAAPAAPGAPVTSTPPSQSLSDVISSPEALAADVPVSQGPNPALDRVGAAAAEGYRNSPPLLTPQARNWLEQSGPINKYITVPAALLAGGALGAVNALGAGIGQAVTETAGAAGQPALGRDLNMLAQVAPAAAMGGVGSGIPRGLPEVAPSVPGNSLLMAGMREGVPGIVAELRARGDANALNAAAPLSAEFKANPLAPGVAERIAAPTAPASAVPGMPAPAVAGVPQSVGAAASRDMSPPGVIDLTPKEVAAYRATAEGQKLLEPQPIGKDLNAYVPGVSPTAAETEQSVNTARELKALNITAPEVSEEAKQIAKDNNEARKRYFERIAGSDVDIMNAKAARAAQAEADLASVWKNKQPANAQPVLDAAAAIKASPEGRRDLVVKAVDAVTRQLTDKDGNLFTDPEQLYGVRKHIDDLMSKEAAADNPASVRAAANLSELKAALDSVIEKSAPGFEQYLKNFAEASRPIDAMEVLAKHENKLSDGENRMTLGRVQTMMRQIVDARAAPGINPYKSIPDEKMAQLFALRDDLRRSAAAKDLASTPGSDTAQNTLDIAKDLGKMAGTVGMHGVANAISPGFGSMAVSGARNMLAPIFSARTARRQTARGMELLRPDRTAQPLRNPLEGP